jgi:hypothetical protein
MESRRGRRDATKATSEAKDTRRRKAAGKTKKRRAGDAGGGRTMSVRIICGARRLVPVNGVDYASASAAWPSSRPKRARRGILITMTSADSSDTAGAYWFAKSTTRNIERLVEVRAAAVTSGRSGL